MFQCEFSNFLDSHLLWLLGIPLRLEVSIKGLEGGRFLFATGNPWSFSGEGWLGVARSQTWRIAKRRMITIDGLNVISMHEPDRRLQGLSGVGIEYPCSSWPLGASKT